MTTAAPPKPGYLTCVTQYWFAPVHVVSSHRTSQRSSAPATHCSQILTTGAPQAPFVHGVPAGQALPHLPQFWASELRSVQPPEEHLTCPAVEQTQVPPEAAVPAGQDATHAPALHSPEAHALPAEQAWPSELRQLPPTCVVPAGHAHVLDAALHVEPDGAWQEHELEPASGATEPATHCVHAGPPVGLNAFGLQTHVCEGDELDASANALHDEVHVPPLGD